MASVCLRSASGLIGSDSETYSAEGKIWLYDCRKNGVRADAAGTCGYGVGVGQIVVIVLKDLLLNSLWISFDSFVYCFIATPRACKMVND